MIAQALAPARTRTSAWSRSPGIPRTEPGGCRRPPPGRGGLDPVAAGVDPDLALRQGPLQPVLNALDPLVANPTVLTLVPKSLPSGRAVADFEDCD